MSVDLPRGFGRDPARKGLLDLLLGGGAADDEVLTDLSGITADIDAAIASGDVSGLRVIAELLLRIANTLADIEARS